MYRDPALRPKTPETSELEPAQPQSQTFAVAVAVAAAAATPEHQPETSELKPQSPSLQNDSPNQRKPETPELKPENSELKPAPRQSQSFGDLRAKAVKDIRIPRASGLVVKTAAKQECTAEGPGVESRLVQFFIACGGSWDAFCASQDQVGAFWDLLGLPGAPREPLGAPPAPGEPQEALEKRPEGPPESPWSAPGGPRAAKTPQNTQHPCWKQQNTENYKTL